jgi:hypothetical protein
MLMVHCWLHAAERMHALHARFLPSASAATVQELVSQICTEEGPRFGSAHTQQLTQAPQLFVDGVLLRPGDSTGLIRDGARLQLVTGAPQVPTHARPRAAACDPPLLQAADEHDACDPAALGAFAAGEGGEGPPSSGRDKDSDSDNDRDSEVLGRYNDADQSFFDADNKRNLEIGLPSPPAAVVGTHNDTSRDY